MAVKHKENSIAALRANDPTPQQAKLNENSSLCRNILENKFKSSVKGDGLQPYRMNDDDQKNLLGYQTMILFGLMQDPTGESLPLFEWKNSNEVICTPTWTFGQILGLVQEFGVWKTKILKRQDEIKNSILKANTDAKLEKIKIDYSDLLNFDGGDGA